MKKIISLIFIVLLVAGCNMAMDSLDVLNGTKYIVKEKKVSKDNYWNSYRLVEAGDSWYDYVYKDTTDFNVGDTIVIIVRRVSD